jgi:long-subunit fatty acid transport protein
MRCAKPRVASLVIASCVALSATRARASAFDAYGFGPEGVASVGARAASVSDGTATYYNPGGLAFGRGYHVEAGALYALSELKAQGQRHPVSDPFGATLAVDADIPFEGPLAHLLRIGYGGYFLPNKLMRLQTPARTDPVFAYYENRSQRLIALPALALRVNRWLGVGVSADIFAGLSGPASLTQGASRALEARIDEEARTTLAAIVGVQARPIPGWRLGFVYHEKFDSADSTLSTSTVGGVPLAVNVGTGQAFFNPDTFELAASTAVNARLDVELDLAYELWSEYRGPAMSTQATLPGVSLSSRAMPDLWRDIWTLRGTASYRLDVGPSDALTLRAGAGVEPSVQKSLEQGETNLIDGNKFLLGLGGTLTLGRVLRGHTLKLGLGVQTQLLSSYFQQKRVCTVGGHCTLDQVWGSDPTQPTQNVTNPGYPTLSGSGSVWAFALSAGVDL